MARGEWGSEPATPKLGTERRDPSTLAPDRYYSDSIGAVACLKCATEVDVYGPEYTSSAGASTCDRCVPAYVRGRGLHHRKPRPTAVTDHDHVYRRHRPSHRSRVPVRSPPPDSPTDYPTGTFTARMEGVRSSRRDSRRRWWVLRSVSRKQGVALTHRHLPPRASSTPSRRWLYFLGSTGSRDAATMHTSVPTRRIAREDLSMRTRARPRRCVARGLRGLSARYACPAISTGTHTLYWLGPGYDRAVPPTTCLPPPPPLSEEKDGCVSCSLGNAWLGPLLICIIVLVLGLVAYGLRAPIERYYSTHAKAIREISQRVTIMVRCGVQSSHTNRPFPFPHLAPHRPTRSSSPCKSCCSSTRPTRKWAAPSSRRRTLGRGRGGAWQPTTADGCYGS